MSVTTEFNSLDLPAFVPGYLVMIKKYDATDVDMNKHMPAILELLVVKAISYSWSSVRGFYFYLAKQVGLRHLDWDCIADIREMAAIFFKHSDLRVIPSRPNFSRSTPFSQSPSSTQEKPLRAVRRGIIRVPVLVILPRIDVRLITLVGFVSVQSILCCTTRNEKCQFLAISASPSKVFIYLHKRVLTWTRTRTRTRIRKQDFSSLILCER